MKQNESKRDRENRTFPRWLIPQMVALEKRGESEAARQELLLGLSYECSVSGACTDFETINKQLE